MSQPLKLVTGAILGVLAVLFIGSVIATDMDVPSGTTGALTVESDPVAIPALIATNNVIQGQLSGKAATNANVSGFNNDAGFVTSAVTNGLYLSSNPSSYITIAPVNATNALLTARIDELANTTWQDAVIDVDLSTPPGSPTSGDRYVVATGGTGAWATKDKNIAQWNGSSWDFTAPVTGMGVNETDSGNDYRYNGTAWTLLTGPAPAKSVSIQELDGSPAIAGATQIKVPNGTLTKSGTSATLAYLSTAVSTNLAAGLPTVVGSELRIGTNTVSGITSLTNDASAAAGTIVGSGSVLGIGTDSSQYKATTTITGTTTLDATANGKLHLVHTTNTQYNITLPAASAFSDGKSLSFADVLQGASATTNFARILLAGADTFSDGIATNFLMRLGETVTFTSDGSSKWVMSEPNLSYVFLATNGTARAIGNSSPTAVTINDSTVISDYGFFNSGTPTLLTAQANGHYLAAAGGYFASSTSGAVRQIRIYRNGAYYCGLKFPASASGSYGTPILYISAVLYLNKGDTVSYYVDQDTGGNLNWTSDFISLVRLTP